MRNPLCPCLSSNQLKIIALITMTIDHIGMYLFPQLLILRIIGRLSMPIYAFMIAEGCRHTHNRKQYLLSMLGLGLICQIVYWLAMGSLYQCILITFSLSIAMIYISDYVKNRATQGAWFLLFIAVTALFFLCVVLPDLLPNTDYSISYGLFGVLLPVFSYYARSKKESILFFSIGLLFMNLNLGGIQWYSFAAVPLLALYNGTRGKRKMKYLFYIYYPAHLVIIYFLGFFFR